MTIQAEIVANRTAMLAYARRLTRNPTAADDVFQMACEFALRAKTPPADNPAAWLNRCVRTAFYRRIRSEQRYVSGGEAIVAMQTMDGAQHHAAELADVARALERMAPGRRDAFMLVAVEGMDGNEAGAVLGISRSAVSVQYRRARAELLAA